MSKKYFKVLRGFGQDDFIPIDASELASALYAHYTGKVAFLNCGSINGSHISAIMPDYARALGYSSNYRMTPDDWVDVDRKNLRTKYEDCLYEAKQRVELVMKSGKVELLKEDLKQIGDGN